MIKFAVNSFLAAKISFINEIGNICKLMGIDVNQVAEGVGLNSRISLHFLQAGIGFGGSCLPKDTRVLITESKELGYQPRLLESVLKINEEQPLRLVWLAESALGTFNGKTIATLGLSFKANTDDVRDSPSIRIITELIRRGAHVRVYDPLKDSM